MNRLPSKTIFFLIVSILGMFFLRNATDVLATVGILEQINFQGKVVNTDGTNVGNGSYAFVFKIYSVSSGGVALWTENQTLTVTDGIFRAALGSVTAFGGSVDWNSDSLYLGVNFNSDGEMGTRIRLTAVPYALNAKTVGGLTVTNTTGTLTIPNGKVISFADNFTTSGANALTLTTTATTNATIPAGTVTLVDTSTSQSIGAKTFTTVAGLTFASGNFDQSASSGIFKTGTGSVSLNGTTTLAASKALIITGAAGDPTSTNGTVWYDTAINKFKIVENGVVKTICNLTDSGCGAGGGARLDQITAATGTSTIANANNAIVWNWGTLTTQRGLTFGGGSAMTTGGVLGVSAATYIHTAAETGNLFNLSVTDASTNTSGNSTTTALNIDTMVNTSGVGTKEVEGINISSPTLTACTTGSCTWDGMEVGLAANSNSLITQNGINIVSAGQSSAGVVNAIKIGDIIGGGATENALSIGSGWDNAISANGNVRIGAQSNTTDANKMAWAKNSGVAGTIGGGVTTAIASVSASVVYNGSLYVGTGKAGAAEVYRFDGGSSWTRVSQSTAGTIAASGTAAINAITSMTVYDGKMYIGTMKAAAAEIYRYDGGTNWTKISQSTAGTIASGGEPGIEGVTAMAVYDGKLFAGTKKSLKAILYRYDGGTTWTAVNTTAGTFVTTAGMDEVTAMTVYKNNLIVAAAKANSADVYRWNGGTGAAVFTKLNTTAGTFVTVSQDRVNAMAIYEGKLFLAIGEPNGADVVVYDDNSIDTTVNTFRRVISAVGTIITGGTANIDEVKSMIVYNGSLYIGTKETGAAQIYKYENNSLWTRLSQTTAGTIAPAGTVSIDTVTTMIAYNASLYLGTEKNAAAEVYFNTIVSGGQSFALKFNASSPYVSETNNLTNDGLISFLASPSANTNSAGGNTGSFYFSHGIMTAFGAYDVAEDYPTRDDTAEFSDVMAVDINERGLVTKTTGKYDRKIVGVYSQNPGLRLSQKDSLIDGARAIPIALAGRVPVKVTTENGVIKPGDTLTSSSIPGVAMKATKAGVVLGRAMEGFNGSGVGKILVYVNVSSFNGDGVMTAVDNTQLSLDDNNLEQISSINTDEIQVGKLKVKRIEAEVDGLSILGKITAKDGLVVAKDSEFQGKTVFKALADFVNRVIFRDDIEFWGRPTFNKDTAGLAVVKKDTDWVEVVFEREYVEIPVVTASVSLIENEDMNLQNRVEGQILNGEVRFVVTRKTRKGFVIKLNRAAEEDLSFAWNAWLVKDLKKVESKSVEIPVSSPSAQPVEMIAPEVVPVSSSSAETLPP